MLRGVAPDVIPWRLRSNEDVHLDLNSGIAIDGPESHAMHIAFMRPAERSPAGLAEEQTPSRCRRIMRQVLGPADPGERAGRDLCVGGTGAAKCLSTSGAVAASSAVEWRTDLVTDATAKTAPGQHCFFPVLDAYCPATAKL